MTAKVLTGSAEPEDYAGWSGSANSRRRSRRTYGVTALVWLAIAVALPSRSDDTAANSDAARWYAANKPNDVITRLQHSIDAGRIQLQYDDQKGYLPAVLKALKVPTSSQMLVFSKTSVQKDLISPSNPRALYFNDNVYIGYVPGGKSLEVAANDPHLGPVYYVLLQRRSERPVFFRAVDACLKCHVIAGSCGLPFNLMRSAIVDAEGVPVKSAPVLDTTDASPFAKRWGGWYVTGSTGGQANMGNRFAKHGGPTLTAEPESIGDGLPTTVDSSAYLRSTSDVVALMVLSHQAPLQNLMLRAGYQTRLAMRSVASGRNREDLLQRVRDACEPLVRALLFCGEAPLNRGPIVGTSGFAREFAVRGPRDRNGRSLRDFDLKRRLFRYPCSYTIYSDAFAALPAPAKEYIYGRLFNVLSGHDRSRPFANLAMGDRRAIQQILIDTDSGYAAWRNRKRLGGTR